MWKQKYTLHVQKTNIFVILYLSYLFHNWCSSVLCYWSKSCWLVWCWCNYHYISLINPLNLRNLRNYLYIYHLFNFSVCYHIWWICLAKIKYWLIDQNLSFVSRVNILVLESFNKVQNPLHKNIYLWLNVLITYLFYSEGVNNLMCWY